MTDIGRVVQFPSGKVAPKEDEPGKHDLTLGGVRYKFNIQKARCGYDVFYTRKRKIPDEMLHILNQVGAGKDGYLDTPVLGEHVHTESWYKRFRWIKRMFLKWHIRKLKKELISALRPAKEDTDDLLNV